MQVDKNILEKLEKLSMVEIKEEQKTQMSENLNEIVNFVENLNELDLDDKDASFTTLQGGTPFREDEPNVNKEVIEIILDNAPKRDNTFFVVPKIIE